MIHSYVSIDHLMSTMSLCVIAVDWHKRDDSCPAVFYSAKFARLVQQSIACFRKFCSVAVCMVLVLGGFDVCTKMYVCLSRELFFGFLLCTCRISSWGSVSWESRSSHARQLISVLFLFLCWIFVLGLYSCWRENRLGKPRTFKHFWHQIPSIKPFYQWCKTL